ncbi:MAG: PKD domain-containing protein, partial [Chitinophagaceae bacterium]
AGTFEITLLANHPDIENCRNQEELKINVIVKDRPKPDFTFVHSGCSADSIHFTGSNTTGNGFTANQFFWSFPGSINDTGQLVAQLLPPGTQPVKLTIVSGEGCVGDTTKQVVVGGLPVASFTVSATSICEGGTITFTNNSPSGASLNGWYWDFGNGVTTELLNNNPQIVTYSTYGQMIIRHAVKSSATCTSDTVQQVIDVFAKPVLGFTYPAGCLPDNGVVQFTSTTTTPDNQVLSTYSWNFGDAGATPSNPNTSNAANPTHTYTNFGSYPIQYSVTTANGCTKDTLVNAVFNLRPRLAFGAVAPLCENAAPVSVANGSVTNGVAGSGSYRGPGTSAAGQFDPSVAGYGLHRIWYVFTSDAGCTDSVYQDVRVHARPQPSFTFPSALCAATGSVSFTNTTTIADGSALSYAWTFNDAASTASNPNTSFSQHPTHDFGDNSYNVQLSATSANGCTAQTSNTVAVSIKPQVAYGTLASVCHTASGSFTIASGSITNGLTGSGYYSGPGTDAAGQFTPSIAGAGIHRVWYHFTTASGCIDSASTTIKVHPRPVADFTVDAAICLDQPATVTDRSTISNGRIVTWNWNLGNGNTPSYSNNAPFPVNYAVANTYTIQLTTISDSGCVSQPATQSITVNPLPVADFTLPTAICMPGGAASFGNTSTMPGGGANFQWNFGDGVSGVTTASPTHNYAASGSYTVTLNAVTAQGCSHDTSKIVSAFFNKPLASFSVNTDTLCQGTESVFTDLTAAPGSPIATRNWTFGDGNTGVGENPRQTYTSPGTYDVRLTVTTDAGCTDDTTMQVIVFLQPVIDAGPSFTVPSGTVVQLRPTANDSSSLQFSWSPAADFVNATVLSGVITALRNQTYTLTALGAGNCTASDTVSVRILNPLNIPNAFSPNGDGINDTWNIGNLADYPGAGVEVFNRYGQKVYSATGYSTPWDGRSSGKPLPIGTYYYVITLRNGFPPVSGSITILK